MSIRSPRRVLRASLFALGAATLAAASSACAVPVRPELDLTPPSATLAPGESTQIAARRRFPGGGFEDVTSRVEYVSSDLAVLTVSRAGFVRAARPGSAVVEVWDRQGDAYASIVVNVVAP